MLHTFTVPVKPHVAKFLLHHLGAGYRLSQLDPFGRELKNLLQLNRKKTYWDGHTGRYTASFCVAVEGNMILQKRLRALTSKSIIDFNNFVEGIIKAEFFGFVDNHRAFKLSKHGAIQSFRAKYDFQDDDISFDTLKKSWQRFEKGTGVYLKRQNPVSVCPPVPTRLVA